jgi:hypothetical protein
MPNDTPGLVQPLMLVVIVLKTYSVVLRSAMVLKVTMVEEYDVKDAASRLQGVQEVAEVEIEHQTDKGEYSHVHGHVPRC